MQVLVDIPDEIFERLKAEGTTPQAYVESLIDNEHPSEPSNATVDTTTFERLFESMDRAFDGVPALSDTALTRASFYEDRG